MSETMKVRIALDVVVKLPQLPNFLLHDTYEQSKVDIAQVSDAALRDIGARWTEALIEHARKRREHELRSPHARD